MQELHITDIARVCEILGRPVNVFEVLETTYIRVTSLEVAAIQLELPRAIRAPEALWGQPQSGGFYRIPIAA